MLITKYGMPQALLFPLALALVMGGLGVLAAGQFWLPAAEAVLAAALVLALSFFRDPPRKPARDDGCLLSPADGVVTDAGFVPESPLGGGAVKIGVFLSVLNAHINRAPCRAAVESVVYRKGAKVNALSPEAGRVNESNNVFMRQLCEPKARLLVRQISGAIARRIVCEAAPGREFAQGEPFGMIKFGSRTELYLACENPETLEITASPGDKVKAGISILVRYKHAK